MQELYIGKGVPYLGFRKILNGANQAIVNDRIGI